MTWPASQTEEIGIFGANRRCPALRKLHVVDLIGGPIGFRIEEMKLANDRPARNPGDQFILFFIKNQSTGEFRSFLARPPGVIRPLGSSVEWIVERPTDPPSGNMSALPAYGSVDFRYCMARASSGGPLAPGRLLTLDDSALMIHMRELFANPNRTVTVSSPELRHDKDGSVGVTCSYKEPKG